MHWSPEFVVSDMPYIDWGVDFTRVDYSISKHIDDKTPVTSLL